MSKQLKRVSFEADYLFGRCIPHLDRDGRLEGDPEIVRVVACPLRKEMTTEVVESAIRELAAADLVVWYEAEGELCLYFPGFENHQVGMKYDRESPSRIPKPPSRTKSGSTPAEVRTNSGDVAPTSGTNSAIKADRIPPREVKLSAVKSSEVKKNGNHPKATEQPSPFPKSACDSLYETWTAARGAIDYGAFRKALKPLYPTAGPRYTEPQLVDAIKAHAEYVEGLAPREAGFENIHKFAADAQRWVRIGGMPAVDPNTRELTERGRLAFA